MKLCYYHDSEGNFGDDLNAWLWPKLLPGVFDGTCRHGQEYYEENDKEEALFYGIGTILDARIPKSPIKFIAGSGVGYFSPPTIDEKYKIYFVRGPKTANKLGIDRSLAITDPAILLREFLSPQKASYKASLIMHCDTAKGGYWKKIADSLGVHYIDPRSSDPLSVIRQLIASEYVITESLHGAIIADAFGIPWLPVNSMPHINQFKWHDWCESMGLEYQPCPLVSIYPSENNGVGKMLLNNAKSVIGRKQLSRILKDNKTFVSDRDILSNHTSHMLEKLEQLKLDAQNLRS